MRLSALSLAALLCLAVSSLYGEEAVGRREQGWERARRYLAGGEASEAKKLGEELLNSYPKDPDIHVLVAIASLRLRDVQVAEVYLRKAIHLDPRHVEARMLLGWIRMEIQRDHAAAVEEYRHVIALVPDSAEAHNNLGVALKKKGDLDAALKAFGRALALRQDYGEAWSNRGWVFAEQRRWREARGDFERGLKLNPRDEGALYGLSQALREARDYAGAEQALRRLVSVSPNFVYWLEWGQLELVRFYWLFLVVAGAAFVHSRYRKNQVRRSPGGR
ncbi:MAG: tetratricopeptide repeat protein [Deltaproteobacteria bacterium]|nr:tetratricopeptide repeat protein [Deltaproteobacteria bacterium]